VDQAELDLEKRACRTALGAIAPADTTSLKAMPLPCGGSSGLPKEAARAAVAVIAAPAAVAANIMRLDIIAHRSS